MVGHFERELGLVGILTRWSGTAVRRRLDEQAAGYVKAALDDAPAMVKVLPGLDRTERTAVRTAFRAAVTRQAAIDVRYNLGKSCARGTAGVAVAAAVIVAIRLNGFAGMVFAVMVATIPIAVRRFGDWRAAEPRPDPTAPVPAHRRLANLVDDVLWPAIVLALFTLLPMLDPRKFNGRRPAALAAGFVIGLAAFECAFLVFTCVYHILTRALPTHPFDEIVKKQTRIIAEMVRLAPAWNRPDVSRYLVHRLEELARTAEERRPWFGRAPFSDPVIRSELRRPAEDLASVIRAHKRAVALARTREAYDKVVASLTAGLLALATDDWETLSANVPARRRRWSSYPYSNLLPATVLGIAALVLPWIPPFRHSSLPTASIRLSLGAFAVLRLIPGPSVADLVDKGLSRGFDAAKRG